MVGNANSGRRPDPTTVAMRQMTQPQTPIANSGNEGFMLPNYSGLQTGIKKTKGDGLDIQTDHPIPGTSDYTARFKRTGAGSASNVRFEGQANTKFSFKVNEALGDEKVYQWVANSAGAFYLGFVNDAENFETQPFIMNRSGAACTYMAMRGDEFYINDNYKDDVTTGNLYLGDYLFTNSGTSINMDLINGILNLENVNDLNINGQTGLNVTITTAKLTALGSNGSMTFTNGILTAQTQAT